MQTYQIKVIQSLVVLAIIVQSSLSLAEVNRPILMVVSGNGEQQGELKPGYEFDEFAKAYLVFKHHNIVVHVASPNGGAVEADQYDPNKPYNAKVLADTSAMQKLKNTLSISQLNAKDYDGIFVVGGKGAMFDLPHNAHLQTLIAQIYEQQGIVAAVCHGPAALVDVTLNDGSYLVAGKAVNGFTNKEERLFGKKWAKEFDFMLEDKLIERGGKFQSSDMMLNHVAVSDRLITGQNPSSTVAVATQLVDALGIKIKPMPAYKDDATLALVASVLDGDSKAQQTLHENEQDVNMPLVGMYGYYYLNTATTDEELKHSVTLMNLASASINNPQLDLQIAKGHQQLGDIASAIATLESILATKPDFQPALNLLQTLSNNR